MFKTIVVGLLVFLAIMDTKAEGEVKDSLPGYLQHYDIESVDVVVTKLKQYQVGSKKETFTPLQKSSVEQGSLTELISRYQPIYIKTDAGGLASFRFRGTSDNHTSVRVRGIELNSQTLGSYNANNAPVFLFDQVQISFGSSSATLGSGSVGGNVRLELQNKFKNGVNGEGKVSLGSFGEYMAGAKVFASNGRLESVTRIVYYEKENDFPFENTAYYNFETRSYDRDKQKNARIENANLIQQLNYKWDDNRMLSSVIWLTKNRHEAQPNMAENTNPNTRYIEDQNIRTWIQYDQNSHIGNFYLGGGYVFDDNIDYSSKEQKISTQRWITEGGLKKEKDWLSMQLGLRYLFIKPDVYAYDESISEYRTSLYASVLATPIDWLKLSLNLRQQFVSRFNAPFTPALGLEMRLINKNNQTLNVIGNIQRAYRIPTLNDRYWGQDGYEGNRNIKPEDALSAELGLGYIFSDNETWTFRLNTNAFYMNVHDWLLWTQGSSGWYADNVMRVISKGLETTIRAYCDLGRQQIEIGGGFTFNPAVRKESDLITDIIDQQLEYVPKYIATGYIQYTFSRAGIILDGNYTGRRYYNQAGKYLSAYQLINCSAFYQFNLGNNLLRFDAQVNNLLSEQYQNQYQYAMPEINYRVAINYKF